METQLKKPSTNSVGNWTPDEDEVILKYVYEKGKSDEHMMWGNLSETLNGRSGKSCRERWFNHLDPKIKRTEWSQEEQWVLFILRNQSQEKWSLISKKLMGRTDNAVKNYWNSRLKKRIDSMQHAVNQHFERKRKQKIALITQSTGEEMAGDLTAKLGEEQLNELSAYMERIKAEYLQKILDQVNNQNVEYFENLACEYTLQFQLLLSGEKAEEVIEEDDDDSQRQAISFINKPDVIKMHLDILYKSVNFLSRERIDSILESYKKNKEKKRREEQERIQMQMQMKKSRGRQSSKRDKDDEEPRLSKPVEQEEKAKSSSRFAGHTSLKSGVPRLGISQKEISQKQSMGSKGSAVGHSVAGSGPADSRGGSKTKKNPQISLNSSSIDVKELSVNKGEGRADQEMEDLTESNGEEPRSGEGSSSSSSSVSVQSSSMRTRRSLRMQKNLGLKKIMKKLKKQKKQFRMMDKIFVFRKEDRDPSQSGSKDPLLLRSDSPTPQDDKETLSDDSHHRDGKRVKFLLNSDRQLARGEGSAGGTPKKSQPSQRLHMKLRNQKHPSRRHGADFDDEAGSKHHSSSKGSKKNLPIQKKPISKYEVRKLNLVKPHQQDRKKRVQPQDKCLSEDKGEESPKSAGEMDAPVVDAPPPQSLPIGGPIFSSNGQYFQQISSFPEGLANNPHVMQAMSSGVASGTEGQGQFPEDNEKSKPSSLNIVTNIFFINNGDQANPVPKPMGQQPSFGPTPMEPGFQQGDPQMFTQQQNFAFQGPPFMQPSAGPPQTFQQPLLQKSHSIPVPTVTSGKRTPGDSTIQAEMESAHFGQNEASDLVPGPIQRTSDCLIPRSTSSKSRDTKQANQGSFGRRTVRSQSKKLPRKRDNYSFNNIFNSTMTQMSQMVGKKHRGLNGLALRKKSSLTRGIPHVTPKDSSTQIPLMQAGLQHSYSFGNLEGLQHQTFTGEFGTPEMKKPQNPVHFRSELILKEAFGLQSSQTPQVNHKNLPNLGASPALIKAASATSGLTFGQFPKDAVASGLAPSGKPQQPVMGSGGSGGGFHRLSDDIGRNEYSADFLSKMKEKKVDVPMQNEE